MTDDSKNQAPENEHARHHPSRHAQGDAPSPYLFNVFMDDFLITINTKTSRAIASFFVGDVLLLVRALIEMQQTLHKAATWATKVQME